MSDRIAIMQPFLDFFDLNLGIPGYDANGLQRQLVRRTERVGLSV